MPLTEEANKAGVPSGPKQDGQILQLSLKVGDDASIAAVVVELEKLGTVQSVQLRPNFIYDGGDFGYPY